MEQRFPSVSLSRCDVPNVLVIRFCIFRALPVFQPQCSGVDWTQFANLIRSL